jgi:hypothetical protein
MTFRPLSTSPLSATQVAGLSSTSLMVIPKLLEVHTAQENSHEICREEQRWKKMLWAIPPWGATLLHRHPHCLPHGCPEEELSCLCRYFLSSVACFSPPRRYQDQPKGQQYHNSVIEVAHSPGPVGRGVVAWRAHQRKGRLAFQGKLSRGDGTACSEGGGIVRPF